jgi:hypothetical protein
MATVRGQNSQRLFSTVDTELVLKASVTTTAGNTTTGSALTVTPDRFYDCTIDITALDATGDDAHITFTLEASDDSTFTTYQALTLSVEQASASDTTGTAYAAAERYHIGIACPFTYMRIVAVVDNDAGATCTWSARLQPMN